MDFLVFLTNPPGGGGPMTLSLPHADLDTVLSGERNRGIEGRGFDVGINVRPSTCLDVLATND